MRNYFVTIYLVVKFMVLFFAWSLVPDAPALVGYALVFLVGVIPLTYVIELYCVRPSTDRIRSHLDRFDHHIADTTRTAL